MGIQGMTNWKFTAFLTIALMLVAGMFSSTAMAAANDGHGTMTVAVTGGPNFQDAADSLPQILFANQTGYTVTFTYTATADMNGGMVQVQIPGDDWKLPKSGVTVTITGDSQILTAAANTDDRLVFTGADDKLTSVGVKLDGDWSDGDALTIAFENGTSAIPRSLYVPPTGYPYREYTFTTTTKADKGNFRRLLIPDDDPDTPADESDVDPQPKIRVGNVASGRGKITFSTTVAPKTAVYQGETDRTIQLTFTAEGPMYDVGGATPIGSNVVITIPQGLGSVADTFPAPMAQTTNASGDEFVSVSRVTGTVQFANPNQRIIVDPTNRNQVTIDITRMEYNATVTVSYRKVDVDPGLTTNAVFSATSISGTATGAAVTFDPAADHVRTIAGSGAIKLTDGSDDIVPMDSRQNLIFTYTAHTALTNADLVITQPDDGTWSALTLVMGSANAQADNYVTVSGGGDGVLTLAATTITLTGLDLAKNGSLTVRINRAVLASTADPPVAIVAGAYGWATTLNTVAVTEPTLYIVNPNDDVEFDVLNAAGTAVDNLPHYPAASERNLYFQFALSTPIKGGGLRFNIPNGWRGPSHTDVANKARVKLLERDAAGALVDSDTADTIPANLVDKYGADDNVVVTASSTQISVAIKTLNGTAAAPVNVTIVYGNGTGDMRGMVQRNAQADLEIIGRFSTGVTGTYYPADSPVLMRIGNVEAGSGAAMITQPPNHKVEAGSDKNTIRIVYSAAGTMNGGRVRLSTPAEWGNLDERAGEKNHIQVVASTNMVNQDAIRYGAHNVLVPLMTAGYTNTVTFVLSNVKAQPKIGLAQFTVESAGGPSDGLVRLMGEPLPKDGDDNITDPYMLLGKVYVPHIALEDGGGNQAAVTAATGQLRLEVVAGAGGTGEAELLEIVRTDSGLRNYPNEEAEEGDPAFVSDRRIHAGDKEIYLVFRYTPVETIEDGALRFTVPSDWSKPQEDSSNVLGYTEISSSASLGAYDFAGHMITIPIGSIVGGENIEIHYGVGSLGATAPTEMKEVSGFNFEVKGTSGGFESIGIKEPVEVLSQASGRGSASVESMNATAGAPDGSITITYTSEGQIANGRIKLTVDAKLTGDPDGDGTADGVMSTSGIAHSSGSAMYGGDMSAADLETYGITKDDILVSGVDMAAEGEFTFKYEGMMPEAAGDLSFTVALDGGEGPLDAEGMAELVEVDGSPLTVTIGQAAAGSGMVSIAPMTSIAASSEDNEITVTYTAIGEIGEGKTITVTVPDGWSPPLNEAAADEKMGTFTAVHADKVAEDDADGLPDGGIIVTASTMKADGAATDAAPMIMVATVPSGQMIKAGDTVTFTYSNATATSMLGESQFVTTYDDMEVAGDDTILVVSPNPATTLMVTSNAMTDGGKFYDKLTVTVMLQDDDGEEATRDAAVTVMLDDGEGDDDAGGTFEPASISIAVGATEGESTYTPADAGDITITAKADLDGDGTDETGSIMVTADTMTPTIDSESISVAPSIAKTDTAVTVSAMATPNRADGTVLFSVSNGVVTDGVMKEDEAGSYTGSFTVTSLHANDVHDVTVRIDGTTPPVTVTVEDALTIDTMVPSVTASDVEEVVGNGATVTISAVVTDNNAGFTVTANLAMLDTEADPAVVTLMHDGVADSNTYTYEHTISADNEAANDTHAVTVTATDIAGNETTDDAMVTLQNSLFFTSMLEGGTVSLIHVPLAEEGLDTVADLKAKLGGDANISLLAGVFGGGWDFAGDDVAITADLGLLVNLREDTTVTFEGRPWGEGSSMIDLTSGLNLVGVPLDAADIDTVSDISGLSDAITGIIALSEGEYRLVAAAGDPGDDAVAGDVAYLVTASDDASIPVMGDGWSNEVEAGAAPIAMAGYKVDNQTPALAVYGSVVDEVTGLAKEGFRVKVKNLSTKAALSEITSTETADGYDMIFVDLTDAHAARVGDVLEISADSPDPLIGIKPVRHIVTVDDVKDSRITLEDLIAYEIPAETELLRNYPNPFNPETWIPYHLSEDANVSLTIYDVNGALVRDIDVGYQTAAKYDTRSKAIYWDGRNLFGEQVASGIYFYSLSAGDFSATRKMVILK